MIVNHTLLRLCRLYLFLHGRARTPQISIDATNRSVAGGMNVKRGLFRLWLLMSALYAGGVFFFAANDVAAAFEKQAHYDAIVAKIDEQKQDSKNRLSNESVRKFDPSTAKLVEERPLPQDKGGTFGGIPVEEPKKAMADDTNPFAKFGPAVSKSAETPKDDPAWATPLQGPHHEPLRLKWSDIPDESPWPLVWRILGKALGIPLLIMGLGLSIGWVGKGFRA